MPLRHAAGSRSALTVTGQPKPHAATDDGAVARDARRDREAAYPELVGSKRCALVVVALETGGRFSAEAFDFLRELSYVRSRDTTPLLRHATALAWCRRWARCLAASAAKSFAASLNAPCAAGAWHAVDGPCPCLAELLTR